MGEIAAGAAVVTNRLDKGRFDRVVQNKANRRSARSGAQHQPIRTQLRPAPLALYRALSAA
ncbi:MAG: hypothetical protein KDI81_06035, partial [Xanthomonadales bacterium]|nr:hypothetical protein [Xanthomonadales bacterium]